MTEKAKKKLSVKGILTALGIVLLILVVLSLIIVLGGSRNKKDNAIIKGDSGTRSLVVYFSQGDDINAEKTDAVSSASVRPDGNGGYVGNAEYSALLFQQATGADLYSIQSSRYYYTNYGLTAYRAFWEEKLNTRPKLIGMPDSLDDYDTIYIGFPIWWFNAPMPVASFLKNYDLSGKTIVPFAVNQGNSVSDSYELLNELCKGAEVKEGMNTNDATLEEVTKWLNEQGYI